MAKNPSEWKVQSNYVGGEYMYICYRLRDVNAVDHSGNREPYGEYTTDKEQAQKLADKLNEEEK